MIRYPISRLSWFLVLLLFLTGCDPSKQSSQAGPQSVTQSRKVMGTFAALTALAQDKTIALAAVEAGYRRLEEVEQLMSDYREDSEVSRLNRLRAGESMVVSPEVFTCLEHAVAVSRVSGGAFDSTCRPLVAMWKRCGAENRLPTEAERKETAERIGWQKVQLDPTDKKVTLTVAGMQIDLGGIGKGYGLDLAAKAMMEAGATSVLVDVGGDVLAIGTRDDDQPWRVGVQHPFTDGIIAKVELKSQAVATSGVQQRFYEIDGKRYSHIIDPRTGWPAEQAPCITVIAEDGITADAWATVFSILSVEEGQAFIKTGNVPTLEVMWITGSAANPVITSTSGFGAYVVK